MKIVIKSLLLSLLFFILFYTFIPKQKIYNHFVKVLAEQKLDISQKNITTTVFGLKIKDIRYSYLGIKFAISQKIDIVSYIFRSQLIIQNIQFDSIMAQFVPLEIKNIVLSHTITDYHKIFITSQFDGGALSGYFDTDINRIFLKLKLTKLFQKKYPNIISYLKKDKNNIYFIFNDYLK
jgi:hypothetical protein